MAERKIINGWIVERRPDGTLVTIGQAGQPTQQQPVYTPLPASPQQSIDNTRNATNDAYQRQKDAQAQADRQQALDAEMTAKGFMRGPDGQWVANPGFRPPVSATDGEAQRLRKVKLDNLVGAINKTQELGNAGPMGTEPWSLASLGDLNPFAEKNSNFNTSAYQMGEFGRAAFRVPGEGTFTNPDAVRFDRANLPTASGYDTDNSIKMDGTRRMVEAEYAGMGLPAPKWVNPLTQDSPEQADQGIDGSLINGINPMGKQRTRFERSPQVESQVRAAFNSGATLEQLNAISTAAGYGPVDPATYYPAAEARDKGLKPNVSFTVGKQVPISRMEEISNSSTGAVGVGLGNAGSFGLVKGLAPEQYAEMNRMNGGAMLGGEVLGSIVGTSMLGQLGRKVAGNIGPLGAKMLGGGKFGTFARNLGTDAAYSGAYGAGSGDGVGQSMVAGGIGSAFGQGLGKIAGGALGGLSRAPGARQLSAAGVPLTTGQQSGGMLKGIEDRLAGYPVVGDIIGNRRVEGFQGFERAAMNEAGSPIGAKFDGGDWSEQLPQEFGQAYDNATAGVNVPLDDTFRQGMAEVSGRNMPGDYAKAFDEIGNHRIAPAIESGALSGDNYQQAMRGINSAKGKAGNVGVSGFEDVYKTNLSDMQDVLKNQMMRGGGSDVVEGLGRADQGYRMAKVIQEAQRKAVNGTGSGVPNLFTPAQLNTAAMSNMKKFGGQRPFSKLAAAGQQVLPSKIPDSGTAGRALMAIGGLTAAGTGGGYATGDGVGDAASGGAKTLAAIAALAAGGSKSGQKAINALLFKRPGAVKGIKAQRAVRKLQGLFGSAAVPLGLEANN